LGIPRSTNSDEFDLEDEIGIRGNPRPGLGTVTGGGGDEQASLFTNSHSGDGFIPTLDDISPFTDPEISRLTIS
jgi:hypothetical protein